MAFFYEFQGELERSSELYERAIEVYVGAVGRTHPSVAKTRIRLGLLYAKTSDYEAGEVRRT